MELTESRVRLGQLLRIPSMEYEALAETVHAHTEIEGLSIEKVSFQSVGDIVTGHVVKPQNQEGPLPTVVCLHETGGTSDQLIAPDFSRDSPRIGWARELARNGYLTLSIDIRGGRQRAGLDIRKAALESLMNGQPYMGLLVRDVMRCVDYLETRSDVDRSKIALTGFSLGACIGWYAAAVDQRINLLAPICGGLGTYRELIHFGNPNYHSAYFWPPGLLERFPGDQPEILKMMVPRPFLVLAKNEDEGMPIKGTLFLERLLKEAYQEAAVPENFAVYISAGQHGFTFDMYEKLTEWLSIHF